RMAGSGGSVKTGDAGNTLINDLTTLVVGVAIKADIVKPGTPVNLEATIVGFEAPSMKFQIWTATGTMPPVTLIDTVPGSLDLAQTPPKVTGTWTPPASGLPAFVVPQCIATDPSGIPFGFGLPVACDQHFIDQPFFDPDTARMGDTVTIRAKAHGFPAGTS